MRNSYTSIFLSFVLAVTFSSCKKSETNSTIGTTATVTAANFGFDGGTSYAFKSTTAGIVKAGNVFTITAIQDASPVAMTIILNNVTGAGTYPLDKGNAQGNGAIITKDYTKPTDVSLNYSTENVSPNGVIGGGQVVITKLTATEAEGTFFIVGYNGSKKDAFAEQGKFSGKLK